MARKQSERVMTTRVQGADGSFDTSRMPDRLIVEEPMTIHLDGVAVATTMRTPGNDFELAAGFCFTDGLLDGAPITGVRYCAGRTTADGRNDFNTVSVETGGRAPVPTPRLGNVSSSCGWCGSDQLDQLCARLAPFSDGEPVDVAVLTAVPERVSAEQRLFEQTGAVHAAAAFDHHGTIALVREDVGRHNAVDKVIGAMALAGEPMLSADMGLFVSGRASIEMVQKAWAGGFRTLLAVSAPTALAVEAAERAGMRLAGFVRDDGFNLYTST